MVAQNKDVKKGENEVKQRKLIEYTKGLKLQSVLAPLFKLFEACAELFVPLIVADIIDKGIPSKDQNYIIIRFIVLIVLGIGSFGFAIAAQYFSSKVANKYSCRIRQGLFDHVQNLSYKELDQLGNATLLTRMTSDVNQIQTGVNMFLRLLLRSPFIVFGSLIMAFVVDVQLALILAIMIPILFVIVVIVMKTTLPKYKDIQNSLDLVTKETRENLTGVRVIRAFTAEDKQTEDFENKNRRYTNLQIAVGKISSIMNPLTILVINLGIVCLLYFGGIKVNQGKLTDGEVVALYNYISFILVELIKLANLVITISKAIACGKRVNSLFNIESSLKFVEKEKINDDFLSFNHVSFKYNKDGKEALNDVSFNVKKNQTIGIIGGTGSGKTTLINLISHKYDISNGSIIYKGYPLNSYSLNELRDDISVVPQKAVLFEGTIRSNLLWGKKDASDEELYRAISLSQSEDIISSKAKGIDEEVEQGGRNFSGGQKQRLTIARALVKDSQILILDDSSSALDYKTDKELRMKLKQLKDTTVFIISQRTSSLVSCDNILVLDHGNLIAQGTHEELLKNCSLYQEIHYCQFEKEEHYETK